MDYIEGININRGEEGMSDEAGEFHWLGTTIECSSCGKNKDQIFFHLSFPGEQGGTIQRTICRDCGLRILDWLVEQEKKA